MFSSGKGKSNTIIFRILLTRTDNKEFEGLKETLSKMMKYDLEDISENLHN